MVLLIHLCRPTMACVRLCLFFFCVCANTMMDSLFLLRSISWIYWGHNGANDDRDYLRDLLHRTWVSQHRSPEWSTQATPAARWLGTSPRYVTILWNENVGTGQSVIIHSSSSKRTDFLRKRIIWWTEGQSTSLIYCDSDRLYESDMHPGAGKQRPIPMKWFWRKALRSPNFKRNYHLNRTH